ncbi:hypothetical protein [Sphingomonas colocasiae]|uniref:hypothetical protein n=1 Tax=Sphingomonas colocasiae TaxID=1848973 RepID=UPI001FE8D68F|nr:hypothetical protein [Sphingomonas colocasiae]
MRADQKALIVVACLASGAIAAPAQAEKRISPYIEIGQVVEADLNNGGDVLTYTNVAVGIEASVRNSRTEVQISYRYDRRFDYDRNIDVNETHTGLARISQQLVPNLLSFEAGGIATRSRVDIRGAAPQVGGSSSNNTTQVYSAYAGPTLATNLGALDVGAAYRFGYTKVEDVTTLRLPTGQQRLDGYDDATAHFVTANVGMRPGELPVGWQISGAFERENVGQLDQRFEGKFIRGDLTVPVSPTLALVGGVGYEDIEISQRDALRDTNGAPVVGNDGRFITDPASPRQLAYDQDGLIYDAGVMWRPSRRTQLEARAGRRYGGTTVFGSFTHQMSSASGVSVVVYDGVESFGRLLQDNVSRLPTNFNVASSRFGGGFNGCVFGANGGGGGGCLDDVFQSINTANFRNRGITGIYTAARGPISLGFGLGYAQRKYFAPRFGNAFSLDGVKDESWFAQAYYGYALTDHSGLDFNAYLDYYKSGIPNAESVLGTGVMGTYYHNFSRNLSASATGQLYSSDQNGFEDSLIASLWLAMRLQY